jgi:hypothetical protein
VSTPRAVSKTKTEKKASKKTSKGFASFPTPATSRTKAPSSVGFGPSEYVMANRVMIRRSDLPEPVDTSALRKGFDKAKKEINDMINEIAGIMTASYNISEIELTISFSADGKFLGFGVGGAASIKIKIAPTSISG